MAHQDAETIRIFMDYVKGLPPEEFIRNMLLCFAAPTIKNLKAACLINFRRHEHENMRFLWLEHADEWLTPLNVKALLLNEYAGGRNALVLVYRQELLAAALGCEKACAILAEYGYPLRDVEACLECLREKYGTGFPHEIGLFLDYPPEDVRGFIENKPAKCSGCWKVYGDVNKALQTFRQYKNAECEAARRILAGRQNIYQEAVSWQKY